MRPQIDTDLHRFCRGISRTNLRMELRGISDIEGKAAMGSGEREGPRASFKSVDAEPIQV